MLIQCVQNMLATGVKGWMCDFGESVPLDAQLWQGQDPQEWHTHYPEVWGQLNKEAITEAANRGLSVCITLLCVRMYVVLCAYSTSKMLCTSCVVELHLVQLIQDCSG